ICDKSSKARTPIDSPTTQLCIAGNEIEYPDLIRLCGRNSHLRNEQRPCPPAGAEVPNPKLQIPGNLSNPKLQNVRCAFWELDIGVSLGFGTWILGFRRAPRWRAWRTCK